MLSEVIDGKKLQINDNRKLQDKKDLESASTLLRRRHSLAGDAGIGLIADHSLVQASIGHSSFHRAEIHGAGPNVHVVFKRCYSCGDLSGNLSGIKLV